MCQMLEIDTLQLDGSRILPPNTRFVNGYMAIRLILKMCVSFYLTILSGISGKIIMAEQVRPGYPKENGLTKLPDSLP